MSYAVRPDRSVITASPFFIAAATLANATDYVDRLHTPILRPSSQADTFAVSYYNRRGGSPRVIHTRFTLGLNAHRKTVILLDGEDRPIESVDVLISMVERINPSAYRSNNNENPQPVRSTSGRSRSRRGSRRSRRGSRTRKIRRTN